MNIQADNITFDGTGHQFCQDYSLSDGMGKVPFTVVSDGCSSSDFTEFGSQMICHIVKRIMHEADMNIILNHEAFANQVMERANKVIETIGMTNSCLFATLIVAFFYEGQIYVYAFGDGCISVVDWNEDITIRQIEYSKNMPFYPIYNNPLDTDMYTDALIRDNFSLNSKTVSYWRKENGVFVEDPILFERVKFNEPTILKYDASLVKTIAITTDGVASFTKDRFQNKPMTDVMENYILFKNFKGSFVKRRVKKYTEELYKDEFENYDDVSVGALFINKFTKEN